MERVISFLVAYIMTCTIQSLPIDNGFMIKYNPVSSKEDVKTSDMGTIFAKIPQETRGPKDEGRQRILSKIFSPEYRDIGAGHTNQVAKLKVPFDYNVTEMWSYLNIPLITQPYSDYKVVVAAAPPNVSLRSGQDKKNMVVYVVIPNDENNEADIEDIPRVYFVNEPSSTKSNPNKKQVIDPILIVDSNRTVTGIKSKEVSKYLRFRNKLTNHFNIKVNNSRFPD